MSEWVDVREQMTYSMAVAAGGLALTTLEDVVPKSLLEMRHDEWWREVGSQV